MFFGFHTKEWGPAPFSGNGPPRDFPCPSSNTKRRSRVWNGEGNVKTVSGHYQVIVCPFIRIRELQPATIHQNYRITNQKMYQDINRNTRQLFIFSIFIVFRWFFWFLSSGYSEIIPGQKIGRDGFIGGYYHISKYPLPQGETDSRVQR